MRVVSHLLRATLRIMHIHVLCVFAHRNGRDWMKTRDAIAKRHVQRLHKLYVHLRPLVFTQPLTSWRRFDLSKSELWNTDEGEQEL